VRGLFVTGTGTGVGKSVLAAAILAAMTAAGEPARAYKPVVTGLDEPPGEWPPDHELLARAARMVPEEVAPLRYGPPVSPHLAGSLAGERIDPARLIAAARGTPSAAGADSRDTAASGSGEGERRGERPVIVEGVGGLLVPLADDFTVRDLAAALRLPLLIAASPGLGTINHTLLTLAAARAAKLDVRAVVFTPWPERPSAMEESNRSTVARLGGVEVALLPRVAGPDTAALAEAGSRLPWRRWTAPPD